MRFSRLSLERYGHFEDCELAFPAGALDFHLVFGANEAGKSTTLAAVGDLLFGFPKTSPYSFRFDTKLLRVGAVLENAGESWAWRRRKGNKETLLDAADVPVSDAPLRALLHNLSAEQFRLSSSLDHRRLRDGGRAITEARDELGQALFAAGTGHASAQALLRSLEEEAEAIWAPSKSRSRLYWQAHREMGEAEERLRAALVRPTAYRHAKEARDRLADEQATLEKARAGHAASLKRLQRIRRLAAPLQQRAALIAARSAAPTPAFDASHAELHAVATSRISEAEMKLHVAEAAWRENAARRAASCAYPRLLVRQEDIDTLVSAAGAPRKAAEDLPGLQIEARRLQAQMESLAAELGYVASDPAALLAALPARTAIADLQDRVDRRAGMTTLLDERRDQRARSCRSRDAARDALEQMAPPVDVEAATAALKLGRMANSVAARAGERQRNVADAAHIESVAWRKLLPWTGSVGDLESLDPPSEEETLEAETRLREAARHLDEQQRALQARQGELEKVELQQQQMVTARRAIPPQEIAALRARRAEAWMPLRDHVETGRALRDPAGVIAAFETAITAADRKADERFDNAEASAQLAAFGREGDLARLDCAQMARNATILSDRLAAVESAWQARLARSGLPERSPIQLRQWRAHREAALQAAARHVEARRLEQEDLDAVEAARARLVAVLAAWPGGGDGALPFGDALGRVERLVEAATQDATRRAAVQSRLEQAQEEVAEAEARIAQIERGQAAWQASWAAAVDDLKLPTARDRLAAVLPFFERLRGTLDAWSVAQERVHGIARDQQRFEAASLELAADCRIVEPGLDALAITTKLRTALQAAREEDRLARELDLSLGRQAEEIAEARRSIAAGEALLAPLLVLGGGIEMEALGAAIQAARDAADARRRLQEIEQAILAGGDGLGLAALAEEAAGADPAALAEGTQTLETQIGELNERIAAAAKAAGEAQHALAALDHGSDAALAAADEQQARAAMAAEAEAYVLKRAQAVMLRWAVERYRERQQHPLLSRASALFGALTLGRYRRLDIDATGEQPSLVAECADGRSVVTIDAMSDGTADQLFLALRLAAIEQSVAAGVVLPFLADDLFINFDDRRAHAGLRVLGEIARHTQVLFFTHHDHLRAIAQDALGPHTVSICELA